MQPIHAVNFAPFSPRGAFSTPQAKAGLCTMKEQTCADTVIFCPGAVQATPFVEQIDFQGKHTTSDEELLDMTRLARQLGLRVFWKPTVNCLDGTWRARISFFDHDVPCETKWSGWFASYRAFQLHFARLAQQAGVELLILGKEKRFCNGSYGAAPGKNHHSFRPPLAYPYTKNASCSMLTPYSRIASPAA